MKKLLLIPILSLIFIGSGCNMQTCFGPRDLAWQKKTCEEAGFKPNYTIRESGQGICRVRCGVPNQE